MDPLENSRAAAQELVSFAQGQGIDLLPLRKDDMFLGDRRWIWFWRKDALPWSGPLGEKEGTLHYNMQGAIGLLPSCLKESAGSFHGAWTEAGTFESIEQAFNLLKAWLIDQREVDELPCRSICRSGI